MAQLDDVVSILKSCIISEKNGLLFGRINREYAELVGSNIPYQKFGHQTLESFIKSIPNIVIQKGGGNEVVLKVIADEKTAHISSLVQRQKTKKQKRKGFNPLRANMYRYPMPVRWTSTTPHYHVGFKPAPYVGYHTGYKPAPNKPTPPPPLMSSRDLAAASIGNLRCNVQPHVRTRIRTSPESRPPTNIEQQPEVDVRGYPLVSSKASEVQQPCNAASAQKTSTELTKASTPLAKASTELTKTSTPLAKASTELTKTSTPLAKASTQPNARVRMPFVEVNKENKLDPAGSLNFAKIKVTVVKNGDRNVEYESQLERKKSQEQKERETVKVTVSKKGERKVVYKDEVDENCLSSQMWALTLKQNPWNDHPSVYGYTFLGDDFLAEVASDLFPKSASQRHVLCAKSLTIQAASRNFHFQRPSYGKVLVLIGATDILLKSSFYNIAEDLCNLVGDLVQLSSEVVVCTVPPLLGMHLGKEVAQTVHLVNELIRCMPEDFDGGVRVLDLHWLLTRNGPSEAFNYFNYHPFGGPVGWSAKGIKLVLKFFREKLSY